MSELENLSKEELEELLAKRKSEEEEVTEDVSEVIEDEVSPESEEPEIEEEEIEELIEEEEIESPPMDSHEIKSEISSLIEDFKRYAGVYGFPTNSQKEKWDSLLSRLKEIASI